MKSIAAMSLAAVSTLALMSEGPKHNYVPKEGYVPNKDVAIKIAVAIWEPIYGADQIAREKPYSATLDKGVWIVRGSLPEGMKGGVAVAEIKKSDSSVVRVSHGK
jgi:hypothetical protein